MKKKSEDVKDEKEDEKLLEALNRRWYSASPKFMEWRKKKKRDGKI